MSQKPGLVPPPVWNSIARIHQTERDDFAITSASGFYGIDGSGKPRPCFSVWQTELASKYSTPQDNRRVFVVPVMSAQSFDDKCFEKSKDPNHPVCHLIARKALH
jgi:hypothetical protein